MLINSNGSAVQAASRVYAGSQSSGNTKRVSSVSGIDRADAFELSSEAQNFSDILNKLQNMSEVREDKVESVRNKDVAQTSSLDIAQKLMLTRF